MISTIREILRFSSDGILNIWTVILIYFWFVWSTKLVCSLLYKPIKSDFITPVSIIVTTYHEDRNILEEVINRILQYPKDIVSEIIIVTDYREPDVTKDLQTKYVDESRLHIISSPPGKRNAVDIGVCSATRDVIVLMDSDTFLGKETIYELIKPFRNEMIGGVVSDQRIYNPYVSLVNFFNTLTEAIKYKITIPALSIFGSVTVLAGRCVAYRKSTVIDLLPNLVNENFLGKKCVSGDDGRLTSLILKDNWKTVYQSTAVVYTVSPPTWSTLIRQRLRWNRNTSRRTIRALFCFDGLWVWKRPAVFLQMLSVWTGSLMMGVVIYAILESIISRSWFWFGTTWEEVIYRFGLFFVGVTLTRIIRISPIVPRYYQTKKWIWFPLFPFYLIVMWIVRIYAILTMNKQGWVTRKESGAGGFMLERK